MISPDITKTELVERFGKFPALEASLMLKLAGNHIRAGKSTSLPDNAQKYKGLFLVPNAIAAAEVVSMAQAGLGIGSNQILHALDVDGVLATIFGGVNTAAVSAVKEMPGQKVLTTNRDVWPGTRRMFEHFVKEFEFSEQPYGNQIFLGADQQSPFLNDRLQGGHTISRGIMRLQDLVGAENLSRDSAGEKINYWQKWVNLLTGFAGGLVIDWFDMNPVAISAQNGFNYPSTLQDFALPVGRSKKGEKMQLSHMHYLNHSMWSLLGEGMLIENLPNRLNIAVCPHVPTVIGPIL